MDSRVHAIRSQFLLTGSSTKPGMDSCPHATFADGWLAHTEWSTTCTPFLLTDGRLFSRHTIRLLSLLVDSRSALPAYNSCRRIVSCVECTAIRLLFLLT